MNRFLVDRLVSAAVDGSSGARALDLYAGDDLLSEQRKSRREMEIKADRLVIENGGVWPMAVKDLASDEDEAGLVPVQLGKADGRKAKGKRDEQQHEHVCRPTDLARLLPTHGAHHRKKAAKSKDRGCLTTRLRA